MRVAGVLVLIWLAIGAIAGGQRHYYNSTPTTCVKAGNIALTIVAGPLPKTSCSAPQPSS